jgi:peptide/nickel transport system ATP-binding protein
MSMILITHDLGVVAEMADDVAVMYLGRVVEQADVDALFYDPKHPYTQALLRSIPRLGDKSAARLETIQGMVPDPYSRPSGCTFRTRCPFVMPGLCDTIVPPAAPVDGGRDVRCLLYGGAEEVPGAAERIAAERARMVPGGIAPPTNGHYHPVESTLAEADDEPANTRPAPEAAHAG